MTSEQDSDQLPVMQLLQALLRGNGGMDRGAMSVQEPDDSAERLRTLQLQALLTTLQVRRFPLSSCAVVLYHGSRLYSIAITQPLSLLAGVVFASLHTGSAVSSCKMLGV